MSHRFSCLASVASYERDEMTLRDVGTGLVYGSEKSHMLSDTDQ
ncbi:hypothetical protein PspLS_06817 [Pyricularia sp. CBS 133598]|nr:hypothetical protein PspLS_06817 [Pyricularia sp. CBS 133598]